jgi:murein DD-endopeptidase MepM/ murein hydrolase activator NlpD
LETIANSHRLSLLTLQRFNPKLSNSLLPVGTLVIIPPINGLVIQAPPGSRWQDLASSYGLRSDVLFELNGCPKKPSLVFIPGILPESKTPKVRKDYLGFPGYPLPTIAPVGLTYGWQEKGSSKFFHSGVDLLAKFNTPVIAVDQGTVVYTGQEGGYGNLVIINHAGNLQTRYAQLNEIRVKIGTKVKTGQVIGTVGRSGQPDISAIHLHFEVRSKEPVGWISQDPLLHLPKSTQ